MKPFVVLSLVFIINIECVAQNDVVTDKFDEALSLLFDKNEYLKADSLFGKLSTDLRAFDDQDYYVYSLFYRGFANAKAEQYLVSLEYLFQALDKNKYVNSGKDYYLLSSIYFGLVDVFYNLGYFELSEYYATKCSEYLKKSDDGYLYSSGALEAMQGWLTFIAGDYYSAIDYFNLALLLNNNTNYYPHHYRWESIKARCNALLKHSDKANQAINKIMNESKKQYPDDNNMYAFVLNEYIYIKLLHKDTLNVKSELAELNKTSKNQHRRLNTYLSYIYYFQQTDQQDSTNAYIQLALSQSLSNVSHNNYKVAQTYLICSEAKFKHKDYSKAYEYILNAQKILTQKQNVVPNEEENISFNPRLLLQVLLHKSRIHFKMNETQLLLSTSSEILKLLDVFLDQHLGVPESKYFFLKKLKPQFEQLISDYILLGENELAFTISQKLHGNLLALEIMKNNALKNYELPEDFALTENKLKTNINEQEIKLSQLEEGIALYDSLTKELIDKRQELTKLTKSIEDSHPGYYALKYASPAVKSVANIQKELLNTKSALVEYFIGDSILYTFVITKNKLEIIQKDIADNFEDHIKHHNGHLKTLIDSPVSFDQYIASTEYLYDVLLSDVFNNISPKVKQFYMVPDGVISYIPFATLFDKCPDQARESRYKLLPFLAKDYNFYYHYSSALFDNQKDKLSTQFAGYAPDFTSYNEEYKLDALAFNKDEVTRINQFSGGDVHVDSSANLSELKESFNQEGILHLATHAESNDSLPLLSRIFLQDGPIHAYEIYNTQTNLNLAVLSACETGDGILREGEGLMSLARSFLSSGCETIITSLWSVNDKNSVGLIESFYRYLYNGKSIGYSLAEAKRDYLDNTQSDLQAHPFNWATFISIGNPNQFFSIFPWNKVVFGLTLFCISMLLWKKKKFFNCG